VKQAERTSQKMNKQILCTICARGGSKGVKNKNIRLLNGKPLIAHTIQQAINSKLFAHIVVSTDDDKIAQEAKKAGAEILFKRPPELAGDKAAKIPVIRHALQESEKYYNQQFPYLIDLDATSPLRSVSDIQESYAKMISGNHANLITAMPARRSPYFNMVEQDKNGNVKLAKQTNPPVRCRQDAPPCYDMNASIYIWKREILLAEDNLFLPTTGLYIMPENRSIDIDCELDFKFVEFIMNNPE